MIKRIDLVSLFCRSLYLREKYGRVANSVSTSVVCFSKKYQKEVNNRIFDGRDRAYEDTFGNIDSFESKFNQIKDDPEDIIEYQKAKAAPGKSVRQYINEIKFHLSNNDYKSAINLFEVDMRNDGVFDKFIYKVLICHNAKLGNLKEAYRLFIDFKKRQGVVPGAMYTSMFNACANCNDSFLAIEKANAVRECMSRNKFHRVNISNYNVMMKAYGRHGDLQTCMKIMDEVLGNRDRVHSETYSFLIQACITDKNSGLRHALLVWRKMLQNQTKPQIHMFNLMLRCIRDCSLGDVSVIPECIQQILKEKDCFYKRKVKVKKIGDTEVKEILKIPVDVPSRLITRMENKSEPPKQILNLDHIETNEAKLLPSSETKADTFESLIVGGQTERHPSDLENQNDSHESCLSEEEGEKSGNASGVTSPSDFGLPNLLALNPTIGSVIEFDKTWTPQNRFLLVGGLKGFLKTMADFGVKPDIKTFTLLLSVIPLTEEAEKELIALTELYNITLDTGFYNVLLKRRIMRKENHLIKDCLEQMYSRNLKPDIITFGILAISCYTHESGIELLKNIRDHGFRVNAEIVNTLLWKAKFAKDMKYLLTILRAAREDQTELSPKSLAQLHVITQQGKRGLLSEKEVESSVKISDKNDAPLQAPETESVQL